MTTPPAEARALEAKALSERVFQKLVVDLAHDFGWLCAHFRPGKTSRVDRQGKEVWVTPMQGDPGFPDLVLCRPPRLIFVELKREGGRATQQQAVWLRALCGVSEFQSIGHRIPEVNVWTPSMWDEIVEVLKP